MITWWKAALALGCMVSHAKVVSVIAAAKTAAGVGLKALIRAMLVPLANAQTMQMSHVMTDPGYS